MKIVAAKPVSCVPASDKFTAEQLRDALGNAALECIELCPDAINDLGEVVEGRMTAEQYRERVKARYGISF